jgi:hypothetical protein
MSKKTNRIRKHKLSDPKVQQFFYAMLEDARAERRLRNRLAAVGVDARPFRLNEIALAAGIPDGRISGLAHPDVEARIMAGALRGEIKARGEPAAQGEPVAGPDSPPGIALTEQESLVLLRIADSAVLVKGPDAYADHKVGVRAGKDALKALEDDGLIHRPKGPRKGYGLTEKGRECAARTRTKSAR